MKNFYTAQEARARLNIPKSSFYDLVRGGTIKKVVLPGKKQGVYPKYEIDRYAAALKAAMELYEPEASVFEPATREDLQAEYDIDLTLYGKRGTTSLKARLDRLIKNPAGNYVLRNSGEVVGHISFYPIERNFLQAYLQELPTRITEGIPIENVLPFTPGVPLDVFIVILSVKPGFPKDVTRRFGLRLIAGAVQQFRELGEQGVRIEHLYATSRTPNGRRLARKLGMQEKEYEKEPGWFCFSLNITTAQSLLVEEYRLGYAEYLKRHNKKPE